MLIENFKTGDIITRVLPFPGNDSSYMGDKLKFIGLLNGCIYLQPLDGIMATIANLYNKEAKYTKLPICHYDKEGWAYWQDINKIPQIKSYENLSLEELKFKLSQVLKEENYEEANKLKEEIEKRKV